MVTAAPPPAFPASAPPPRILICGVNWLGDAIMSMPAIQAFRWENPSADLTLLVKPRLAPLWAMHAAPTRVITFPDECWIAPTIRTLRDLQCEVAYVLPHSFRSAWIPTLAGIPARIGLPGHFPRDFLLTEVRRPAGGPGREHQVFEYLDLFFPGANRRTFPPPALSVPPPVLEAMHQKMDPMPQPWIALLPGAARGPAKQWPIESYALAAARLMAETGGSIITLGTAAERADCQQVAAAAAPNGLNLAGETSLPELAAVLSLSAAVLCNDSGGMHLAAALGTPVVGLFGITHPGLTGPLGKNVRILQQSENRRRDVPRHSREAVRALRAISVDDAVAAVISLLRKI